MDNATRTKTVIFVCTGNTCRSPMAECLFRRETEKLGLKKLKTSSAGIKAKTRDTINEKSAQVLAENGMEMSTFTSKKLNKRMLTQAFAIVCMTDAQRDIVMEMRWKALREKGEEDIQNNVYSFTGLVGYQIIDPYGKDIDCYRYVYGLLEGGMPTLIDRLIPNEIRAELKNKPRGRKKKTKDI